MCISRNTRVRNDTYDRIQMRRIKWYETRFGEISWFFFLKPRLKGKGNRYLDARLVVKMPLAATFCEQTLPSVSSESGAQTRLSAHDTACSIKKKKRKKKDSLINKLNV